MTSENVLTSKFNHRTFRLDGIRRSKHLPVKYQSTHVFRTRVMGSAGTAAELPSDIDLRLDMTPVEDQSQILSCTANALVGAYEYLLKKTTGRDIDMSRLFVYYNARARANPEEPVEDGGCAITDAIDGFQEFGTCLEAVWPYEPQHVNARPSEQAYEQGKEHRAIDPIRVEINLDAMKSCLAQGFPIAFGLELFASFNEAEEAGIVPMPSLNEDVRQTHGNHAMLAVGFNDQSNTFIVRNSWGTDWGDNGYCYIPYEYMANEQFCFDAWSIRASKVDDSILPWSISNVNDPSNIDGHSSDFIMDDYLTNDSMIQDYDAYTDDQPY